MDQPGSHGHSRAAVSGNSAPRQSLYELVYAKVVDQIFSLDYTTGDKLPTESELADQFQVSRVTVRLALRKLRDQRLIVSVQGSGNYVGGLPLSNRGEILASITGADYRDVVSFRIALETQAAALAAEHRTPEDIALLREILAAHDCPELPIVDCIVILRLADLRFHEAIRRASRNPLLISMLSSMSPQFFSHWFRHKEDMIRNISWVARRVVREHTAIAEAIIAGDADAAGSAMAEHLKQTHDWVDTRQRAAALT